MIQSFGGLPIYGWEFFDTDEKDFPRWADRLSLDYRTDVETAHSITVFQEASDRHLDVCLWFSRLEIKDPSGEGISMEAFIAGGRRWWDALYKGDERTSDSGIIPLKNVRNE